MCGRAYETYTEEELQMRYLNRRMQRSLNLKPNYNLSPTQISPVVLVKNDERTIELFRWGLIPSWAKSVKDASKYSLINAKGEEIDEKRSYKNAFQRRRCIVPLSGFYEWKREGEKSKRPFAIHGKKDPILSMAGIWEHWESKESGEIVESFSIITTGANELMESIHDRMPVILASKDEELWLDPEVQDVDRLKKLLKPCKASLLEAHEVSTLVNSPKNNRPEVLDPLE